MKKIDFNEIKKKRFFFRSICVNLIKKKKISLHVTHPVLADLNCFLFFNNLLK